MSGRAHKDERRHDKVGSAKNGVKPASEVSDGGKVDYEAMYTSAADKARKRGGKGTPGESGSES